MEEKKVISIKRQIWKLIILIVILSLPILYFLYVGNVWWIKDFFREKYYYFVIKNKFETYLQKHGYKFLYPINLPPSFNTTDIKTIFEAIEYNNCKLVLYNRKSSVYNLYGYKINKCYVSWNLYVFNADLITLTKSPFTWKNTLYSAWEYENYNIEKENINYLFYVYNDNVYLFKDRSFRFVKNLGDNFYILSKDGRNKLFYFVSDLSKFKRNELEKLNYILWWKEIIWNKWLELSDFDKNIDKVFIYHSWSIFEISVKYKNSFEGKKIVFDTNNLRILAEKKLIYIVCDSNWKCHDDFKEKIKSISLNKIVWWRELKWSFKTWAIDEVVIFVSGDCMNEKYVINDNLLTGIDYKFPIQISGYWYCYTTDIKVLLKGRKYTYEKLFPGERWYFLIKKYSPRIWLYTLKYWDGFGLYYVSGDQINSNNPYLLKTISNLSIFTKLPKISIYKSWTNYIIWILYSWRNQASIVYFDAKSFVKNEEKVDIRYFRCNKNNWRCYDDFKETVISLWVKNLIDRWLVRWIFKRWKIKSGSIVLSWCINGVYKIDDDLYSGVNYIFPIKLSSNFNKNKCKVIKWLIILTWKDGVVYNKNFKLLPPFLVEKIWKNLYKFWDWRDLELVYASWDLRKNVFLAYLGENDKIHLYISWNIYHIWISYSWSNFWRIIELNVKSWKILKNEKANYLVCKKNGFCYDEFRNIVKDIKITKNLFWGSIIWILKKWIVKKIVVQPLTGDCELDTEPYELKKFQPWWTSFKYNFKLKFKNICKDWWRFKIIFETVDWRKYETVISVYWEFYDEDYLPYKLIVLKKVCKKLNDGEELNDSVKLVCKLWYFLTKKGKIDIYIWNNSYPDGYSYYFFGYNSGKNIVEDSSDFVVGLINFYFEINKYDWLIKNYEINDDISFENFKFEKLDSSFDVINYSGYNLYKKGEIIYIKAPRQDILVPINLNLPCKWPFCEDLTKFDWVKSNDPDLKRYRWKDIVVYEKNWRYYIEDPKLEDGKYLMPVYVDLRKLFDGDIYIWWVPYKIVGITYKLDKSFTYIKDVNTSKWTFQIYVADWEYSVYINWWSWLLKSFVVPIEIDQYAITDWIIIFWGKYQNHPWNYTIWHNDWTPNWTVTSTVVENNISEKDLEQIWTWLWYPVYRIKNPNNEILRQFYCSRYSEYDENWNPVCNTNTKNYKNFVKEDPILIWKDPLGRYIRMTNMIYAPQAEKAKPVIYLYPTKRQKVFVKVWLNWEFLTTIPKYQNWWKVIAYPNGTIISNWKKYDYLYRDWIDKNYNPPKKWFVIKNDKKEIKLFLEKILKQVWFNSREIKDFLEYWLPILSKVKWKYIFIWFKFTDNLQKETPLFVDPKPDTVIRIFMDYHWLDKFIKVKEPVITKVDRKGFVVVEWWGRKY